jgi:hypothetical protein
MSFRILFTRIPYQDLCRKVSRYKRASTKSLGLRFSATLTESGAERLELMRV